MCVYIYTYKRSSANLQKDKYKQKPDLGQTARKK